MSDTQERMTSAEYRAMQGVGFDPPEMAPGAPLIDHMFGHGAPFCKPDRRGVVLKSEDLVSAKFFELMREAIRSQSFVGMCSHVANESHDYGTKRAILRTQKKKAMGLISGSPDWWFIWTTFGTLGAGVIELKRPGVREGGLSDNQLLVRDWCRSCGIPWACHNKAEAAFEQLVEWRAVRPGAVNTALLKNGGGHCV